MKFLRVLVPVLMPLSVSVAVLATVAYLGASERACYDAGRVVGGAEQRAYDSTLNGVTPMARDADVVKSGPPKGC